MKGVKLEYRPCPNCTYPLHYYKSFVGEITYIVTKCGNIKCSYTRKRKARKPKI